MPFNFSDVQKWFEQHTEVVATVVETEGICSTVDSIRGFLTEPPKPETQKVVIDGKEIWASSIEEFDPMCAEMGQIFFEELRNEINREVLRKLGIVK